MTVGWVVLGDYDLSGLLAAHADQREVKSINICHPELARPFVAAEALTAPCMLCSVLIYTDGTGTKSRLCSQALSHAAAFSGRRSSGR